jgi:hypothetical protein
LPLQSSRAAPLHGKRLFLEKRVDIVTAVAKTISHFYLFEMTHTPHRKLEIFPSFIRFGDVNFNRLAHETVGYKPIFKHQNSILNLNFYPVMFSDIGNGVRMMLSEGGRVLPVSRFRDIVPSVTITPIYKREAGTERQTVFIFSFPNQISSHFLARSQEADFSATFINNSSRLLKHDKS